jgi:hypothetical protein
VARRIAIGALEEAIVGLRRKPIVVEERFGALGN